MGYAGRVVEHMKDDDAKKRGGLVSAGDISLDLPGVGRKLTARRATSPGLTR